ncbi:MAG: ABC transporter permease, partial [Acidobacteriota bacterium]
PWTREAAVSPGFFEAFGVRPAAGRAFGPQDRRDGQPVALVNRPFVERFFPGEDPIGRRIRLGTAPSGEDPGEPWRTIVGVVPDTSMGGADDNDDPETVFVPLSQTETRFVSIAAAAGGDPMALTPAVRDAVASLDPYLPIYWVRTLQDAIDLDMWFVDVFGAIFAIFGLAGLFLATVGLYGVMAFSVQRRTREVGVRMALGAGGKSILGLVLRQGTVQLALGTLLGLGLALGLARGIQLILFRVEPWDPTIFATIAAVLVLTGLTAALVPARRAVAVDPVVALRQE